MSEEKLTRQGEALDQKHTDILVANIDEKLDKILDRIDSRIDEGLREDRALTMRMFTFVTTFSAISMICLIGKFLNLY